MAMVKSTNYFLMFIATIIALSLLISSQQTQTGFSAFSIQDPDINASCYDDHTPPTIHYINITSNPLCAGQTVNFTTKITDNEYVSKVILEINGTNYTMDKAHCWYDWHGDFHIDCFDDGWGYCEDIWFYSWTAPSSGYYDVTVWAKDGNGNWAHKHSNFTCYQSALAIALSNVLAAGVDWNVTNLPAYNLSANGNNGSGITNYYVLVQAVGLNADLYVKADGNLISNTSYIPLANEKLSYDIANSTVPSAIKKSLTTNYSNNQIGYNLTNSTKSWLKFFLNVSSGQSIGNYSNILTFKVVQIGNSP